MKRHPEKFGPFYLSLLVAFAIGLCTAATAGDVIIKLADLDIADLQDLADALSKHKAGQKVEIVVRRDDIQRTLSLTLGEPRGTP